ncbi:MAG: spore maturation protein [Clostridia bacterium]|jgi:spore maturation protein A|nr:spore maturation protein [Clostridia bacterium]
MDTVFFVLLAVGIVWETAACGPGAVLASLIRGADTAVQTGIRMGGGLLFWLGIMGIVQRTGLMQSLSRRLRPAILWLFPDAGGAQEAIALNLSCNMLGLGSAATPYGLEAMRIMEAENPRRGVATDSMCVLLAVNASCLELFPATLLGLRQSFGSTDPARVVLPVLLSSACSTLVTVALCRVCCRR